MNRLFSKDTENGETAKPAWLAPFVVLAVVITLIVVGRKREEAIENPLVDLLILTVGVFAFAAAFRALATKLGSPGLASFFGGSVSHTNPNPTV